MQILDRSAILAASDRKVEAVDVPEWNGRVFVRSLTAGDRSAWAAAMRDDADRAGLLMIARAVCDADGVRIFGDDDLDALAEKSTAAIDRLVDAVLRVNGMRPEQIEEIEGN